AGAGAHRRARLGAAHGDSGADGERAHADARTLGHQLHLSQGQLAREPAPVAIAPMRPTHVRWVPILALVAIGTAINYLDRTVLGIAAPFLTKDLGLSATEMGFVFSAFSWSYAALQIPGGIFLDRFGTRLTY